MVICNRLHGLLVRFYTSALTDIVVAAAVVQLAHSHMHVSALPMGDGYC